MLFFQVVILFLYLNEKNSKPSNKNYIYADFESVIRIFLYFKSKILENF